MHRRRHELWIVAQFPADCTTRTAGIPGPLGGQGLQSNIYARGNVLVEGIRILELANKAYSLYQNQPAMKKPGF